MAEIDIGELRARHELLIADFSHIASSAILDLLYAGIVVAVKQNAIMIVVQTQCCSKF
jgi:hypothetical protein